MASSGPTGAPSPRRTLSTRGCGRSNTSTASRTLTTGWLVAIDGRLEWREWNAEDGTKRHAVTIVGNIEFLAAPNGHKRPAHPQDEDIAF